MTTVMIYGLILMIARLCMRIGILLVVVWGVVRLVDRWRFAPVVPVAPTNVSQNESVAVSDATEVKE